MIGNVAMDETFAVDRLPVEGESVLGSRRSSDLGGKGANQAIMMARAGMDVTFVAGIGDDLAADRMRRRLTAEPLRAELVTLPGVASDLSIVVTDAAGGNTILTTVDCSRSLTLDHLGRALAPATKGDMLVLQGNLTAGLTGALIDLAWARGMRSVLNPSPADPAQGGLLGRVDLVFLNDGEAEYFTAMRGVAAVRDLLARGTGQVVLTLGAAGALLGDAAGIVPVPATRAELVDPTGAGDTFQAIALAHAGARRLSPADLACAARAAAVTVSRVGTVAAMPTPDEAARLLAG
ncbi:PfkB family carbohydrate kinase [Palleronia sediminis]|uniref:PfkB family carbohydrate kinase n=1 Tax=Palleronia sediminis TaxID=2547833 RepID=UPI001F0FCAEF|nr:PfkB family carbohydrate kinase [Palleronia sediminis]